MPECCIYCGRHFNASRGQGDHIIPAALGEFEHDLRFRRICNSCNNRLGANDQYLLANGPEGMFRDTIQPRSKRIRRRHKRANESNRATTFSWDEWRFSGTSPSNDPWNCNAVDQLVIRDKNGRDHSIRLYPNMRPEQLDQQIDNLPIGATDELEMRLVYRDDSDLNAYLALLQAKWPGMRIQQALDASTDAERVYQVPICREFRVGVQYFQAVAKMAFHYYLVHSQHNWRGDEDNFADIRDFILNGKGKEQCFHSSGKLIVDPCSPETQGKLATVPIHWCHLLAADETHGTAVVRLRLFVGPRALPEAHHVTLGRCNSLILVPQSVWAHIYRYEDDRGSGRYCGQVQQVPMRRISLGPEAQ